VLSDLLAAAEAFFGGSLLEELLFLPDHLQAEDNEGQARDDDRCQKK
jgi:hypothetical protein